MKKYMLFYLCRQAINTWTARTPMLVSVLVTMSLAFGIFLFALSLSYTILVKPLALEAKGNVWVSADLERSSHGIYHAVKVYQAQSLLDNMTLLVYRKMLLKSGDMFKNLPVIFTTPNFDSLIKVPMAKGRFFDQREEINSDSKVVIINYDIWKEKYNLDEDILNRTLPLYGEEFKIIGVVAPSYIEPEINWNGEKTGIWLPLDAIPGYKEHIKSWAYTFDGDVFILGSLRESHSKIETEAELNRALGAIKDEPSHYDAKPSPIRLTPIKEAIAGREKDILWIFNIGVLGVLAIACANILNVFLSLALERLNVMAVHSTMGAQRSHIYAMLFSEVYLVLLLSLGIGYILSNLFVEIISTHLFMLFPRISELSISAIPFLVALVTVTLISIIYSLIIAKYYHSRDILSSLSRSGKGVRHHMPSRMRSLLVSSQIALSMALLIINFDIFLSSAKNILDHISFSGEDIYIVFAIPQEGKGWPKVDAEERIITGFIDKLQADPAVKYVSRSTPPIWTAGEWRFTDLTNTSEINARAKYVDNTYFKLTQQSLIDGQLFNPQLHTYYAATMHAIINDTMAEELAENGDVIGRELAFEKPVKIIGVVQSLPFEKHSNKVYLASALWSTMFMVNYHSGRALDPDTLSKYLLEISDELILAWHTPLSEVRKAHLIPHISKALTTAVISMLILLLTWVGLFNIVSYSIQVRRSEFGIRMALGAMPAEIYLLTVKSQILPLFLGILLAVGVCLSVYSPTYFEGGSTVIAYTCSIIFTMAIMSLVSLFALRSHLFNSGKFKSNNVKYNNGIWANLRKA